MQAVRRDDPRAEDDEVETVKAAYLARAHGDVHAAFEMLALNSVVVVREYDAMIRRHVSRGYVRAVPPQTDVR